MKPIVLFKIISAVFVSSISYSAVAAETGLSGNIGVVTKYIYRGGIENNDLAAQGGLEYAHKSGIHAGYWGSTLDYNPAKEDKATGFEHDLYIAYAKQLNPDWSYRLQSTAYIYHNANKVSAEQGGHRNVTTYDVSAAVNYKNLSLATAVIVADASSSNAGDTYISAAYSHPLVYDLSLNTSIGATAYNHSHDDDIVTTSKDFTLSEARLGLSKKFTNTGLVASIDYIYGGKNRMGEDYKDHTVLGLNYQF
ncbi:TorF family putative porin [Acinetobacter rudis]|uniref:TorF family putative porin n=1 Tax=Acinetobacter rudis TaxID=632955 RepID=A0AAW8J6I9_9GAMM|nr:TorF family putative porin [Acinetobacter rudis]MDQ8934195.1 TorF family putative porin [Acinetobacter rudis]MDQ9016497.1 TorF family putative porin [Acinetobacter rudis]